MEKKDPEKLPGWMKEGRLTAAALSDELINIREPGEPLPTFVNEFLEDQKKQEPLFGLTTPKLSTSPLVRLQYAGDELPVMDHLVELWTLLRRVAKIVFLITLAVLVVPGYSNGLITINPYHPLVLQILNGVISYGVSALKQGNGNTDVYIQSPLAPVSLYLSFAVFIAVIISLPVTAKELYSYIRPGLTQKEDQVIKKVGLVALLLFVTGVAISFYSIVPITMRILAVSTTFIVDVRPWFSLDSLINILLWGTLGAGLLYASPMIVVALVQLNILTAEQVAARRREMIFIVFTLAAILTPDPTPVSTLILSIPMLLIIEGVILWSVSIELNRNLNNIAT